MAHLVTFGSLAEALRHGYQIFDRTRSGYLVRARTRHGWVLATVVFEHE